VIAAAALAEAAEEMSAKKASKTARKRAEAAAMKEVSEFLGNTPALARSSYVDPRVIDAFEEGTTIGTANNRRYKTADARQAALERAVLRLLKEA
jgi:DNA topoisomerase IB